MQLTYTDHHSGPVIKIQPEQPVSGVGVPRRQPHRRQA